MRTLSLLLLLLLSAICAHASHGNRRLLTGLTGLKASEAPECTTGCEVVPEIDTCSGIIDEICCSKEVELDDCGNVVAPTECVLVIKAAAEEEVVKEHPLLKQSFELYSGDGKAAALSSVGASSTAGAGASAGAAAGGASGGGELKLLSLTLAAPELPLVWEDSTAAKKFSCVCAVPEEEEAAAGEEALPEGFDLSLLKKMAEAPSGGDDDDAGPILGGGASASASAAAAASGANSLTAVDISTLVGDGSAAASSRASAFAGGLDG